LITEYYQGRTIGDQLEAARICERWTRTYPREVLPHSFLSGFIYPTLGRYPSALAEAKAVLADDPDSEIGYLNFAANAMALGDYEQAARALQHAKERRLETPFLLGMQHDLDFVKGDERAIQGDIAAASLIPEADDWIMQHQAFAAAYHGRLTEAAGLANRAAQIALHNSRTEKAASLQAPVAIWEALFGQYSAARRDAVATLRLSQDREVKYAVAMAMAFALSGESGKAQALATDLERTYPKDTSVQFNYLPSLRAAIALARHDAREALRCLQGAAEFQKIDERPGVMLTDPGGVLSILELAHAHAMVGDGAKAEVAYARFSKLWAGADQNLPAMKLARIRVKEPHFAFTE
jgi:tetratricopeptide (TPR) repeat protein